MYSPKIREDLISPIYHAAKASGTPMTKWVSRALEKALSGAPEPQTLNDRKEANVSLEHERNSMKSESVNYQSPGGPL